MELDKNTVDAILYVLIEHQYVEGRDVYDKSEEYRKNIAERWIKEAEQAWIENPSFAKKDEAIMTVLNLSPNGIPQKILEINEPAKHSILEALPIPKDPDFKYEHLPADFTELTDMEIRRYSSHNQHFLNRARYLLSQVINHQANALHLRDEAYRRAYKESHDSIVNEGERPTKDLIDSYAKEDAEFKRYDEDAIEAQADIVSLKALVEVYSGNVERLSREWTMRQNEWEKTR